MLRSSIVSVGKCTDCADVLFCCSHPTPFYILTAQWIAIAGSQASDALWKVIACNILMSGAESGLL